MVEFERENERWPSSAAWCPEEEVQLAIWCAHEKYIHKNPAHRHYNVEPAARMKEHGYLCGVWETRLQDVVNFESKHERWPKREAKYVCQGGEAWQMAVQGESLPQQLRAQTLQSGTGGGAQGVRLLVIMYTKDNLLRCVITMFIRMQLCSPSLSNTSASSATGVLALLPCVALLPRSRLLAQHRAMVVNRETWAFDTPHDCLSLSTLDAEYCDPPDADESQW